MESGDEWRASGPPLMFSLSLDMKSRHYQQDMLYTALYMWQRRFFMVLGFGVFLAPTFASAQGLVPCNGPDCQTCDILKLIQNLISYAITLGTTISIILIAKTGLEMVLQGTDNPLTHSALRNRLKNITIGFALMLGAWTIVDASMKLFLNDQVYGGWNKITCVAPVRPVNVQVSPGVSTATATPVSAIGVPIVVVDTSGVNALTTTSVRQKYGVQITNVCGRSSLGSGACTEVLAALITKESGGNPQAVSPAGALGLMQLLPANGGKTCSVSDTACINDQISRGASYLDALYQKAGGDVCSDTCRIQWRTRSAFAKCMLLGGSAISV